MAIIKTVNTEEMAFALREELLPVFDPYAPAWSAGMVEDFAHVLRATMGWAEGPVEGQHGGTSDVSRTTTAGKIETTVKHSDRSDDGINRVSGEERYTLAGSSLDTDPWGFTSLTVTENFKHKWVDWGTQDYADISSLNAQLSVEDFRMIVTRVESSENGKYTGDAGGKYSGTDVGKYGFTGSMVFSWDDNSVLYQQSFLLRTLSDSWTHNRKEVAKTSSESLKLVLDSAQGVQWSGDDASGTLQKLEYGYKNSVKGSAEGNSDVEHSYRSSGTVDFSRIATLEDWVSALLEGDDTIIGTSKQGNSLSGGAGHDAIKGNKGADHLYGDTGNDKLDGGAGQDFLSGGDGNDTLKGGAGNDDLLGGAGNDTLDGGAGDDVIVGGAGVDILKGGAGADEFVFSGADSDLLVAAQLDTLSDFKIKQGDKLVCHGEFGSEQVTIRLGKDDLAESYADLLAAANASGSDIYVGFSRDDKKHGFAFVDVTGDGIMDMAIKMVGITSASKIDAASFIFESYT